MISLLHYQNETNKELNSPFSPNVVKMKKSIDFTTKKQKFLIETNNSSNSKSHKKIIIESVFLHFLYLIGLLEMLIEKDVTDLMSFDWLSLPKYCLEF